MAHRKEAFPGWVWYGVYTRVCVHMNEGGKGVCDMCVNVYVSVGVYKCMGM
jgi:hypothetical protein